MTYKCRECAHFAVCEDWVVDHPEDHPNFPYEHIDKPCIYYRPAYSLPTFDIGDPVYYIDYKYDKELKKHLPDCVVEGKVSAMTLKADKTWKIRITTHHRSVVEYKLEDFGKTIYSTKAQADIALADLERMRLLDDYTI